MKTIEFSVEEIRLLIFALPHGLHSDHLTPTEKGDLRGLIARFQEAVNGGKQNPAIGGDGC